MEKTLQATAGAVIVLAGMVIFTGCTGQDQVLRKRGYIPAPHASVNVPPPTTVYVGGTGEAGTQEIVDFDAPAAPVIDDNVAVPAPTTNVPATGESRFKPFVGTMSGPSASEAPEYKGGRAAGSTAVAGKGEYIVQKGDSLSVIAQRHKVKTADLAAVNNLQLNSVIRVGQKLKLPQGAAATAGATKSVTSAEKPAATAAPADGIHVVKSGDSLWKIARQYNISIKTICELNNIDESATLKLGQKLKVNANASSTPAPVAPPTPPTQTEVTLVEPMTMPDNTPVVDHAPTDVVIPVTEEPSIETQTSLVTKDMSLTDYCRMYKWEIEDLLRLNPNLTHDSVLRQNETIVLPSRDTR